MAVTAVFQADFTSFDAGVKGAEAGLKSFEGTSKGTEAQLQRMTRTAEGGTGPAQGLTAAYRQFDGVLAAAGIHIGPYVKGLEDIAAASGKTASQLGTLATAGTIAAAAFTGWKIGTMIDEFFGLSAAVVTAMENFYGYGTAIETAGAKQDVINRAIAQGAKETIAYTEAIKFNEEAMKTRVAAGIDWTGKLADAQREVRNLSEAEERGIEIAQRAGASVEEITRKYGISALALKELGERKKVTSDQADNHAKALEKEAAAASKLDAEYQKLMSDVTNAAQLAIMEADASDLAWAADQKRIEAWREINRARDEAEAQTTALIEQEALLEAAYQKTVDAMQQVSTASSAMRGGGGSDLVGGGYLPPGASQILGQSAGGAGSYGGYYKGSEQPDLVAMGVLKPTGGNVTNMTNHINVVDTQENLARQISYSIFNTVKSGTQVSVS